MRELTTNLREINNSIQRQYRFRVEIWDILSSGSPGISEIISAGVVSHSEYMLDVTPFVMNGLTWQEPGDRRASRVEFSLVDTTSRFHPDYGSDARFMRINQLVRLLEGDASLSESEWVYTFTGHIRGQVGYQESREHAIRSTRIVAYGRRSTPKYTKQIFISQEYGKRVDLMDIINDIAREQMSLSDVELANLPSRLGKTTQFESNSIIELTPLEAIDKILETLGYVSDFAGDGTLRIYSKDLRRAPDKIYEIPDQLISYEFPPAEVDAINQVTIIGLDKNITLVEQPEQALATANMTVGFWRPTQKVRVYWSKDRMLRAKNVQFLIKQSVNDSIIGSFGDERFRQIDDFSGEIEISIDDYVYSLITLIVVTLLSKATIGDLVIVPPLGGVTTTITVGRILEAFVMIEIYLAMATVGSGVYEIRGNPLLPVYQELMVTVTENGTPDYLVREKIIDNDWMNEQEEMLALAELELIFEAAQRKPRQFSIMNDLELEIGDIVRLPIGGGILIWIDSLEKTISRDEVPVLRVSGYKIGGD